MPRSIVFVAGLLAMVSLAHAQMSFTSQERRVSASTDGGSESFESFGLGVFDETATSMFPEGSAGALGSQTSTLAPASIVAVGNASAGAINAFAASASSVLDVTFELDQAWDYTFVGSLDFVDIFDASVTLFGPSGEEVFRLGLIDLETFEFVSSLDTSGTLTPGEYRLVAQADGFTTAGPIDPSGGFDFAFNVVPTPGGAALFACLLLVVRSRRA